MVKEFAVVGFTVVLQHTPCVVIAAPPVDMTVPPEFAELAVIVLTAVVVAGFAEAGVVLLGVAFAVVVWVGVEIVLGLAVGIALP